MCRFTLTFTMYIVTLPFTTYHDSFTLPKSGPFGGITRDSVLIPKGGVGRNVGSTEMDIKLW